MRSIIVGTAGHIDHGKTALVRALTGIDTDRLEEEKRRGISIDLGFAHLKLAENLRVAFIDVPGHERFIKNMLAGVGGIDLVLFVISADESIKPQTREHFEICRLLRIPRGIIALTKVDLVDKDILELVKLETAELVSGSFLETAPVVGVSAITGEGLDELRTHLGEMARSVADRPTTRNFRMPVDRAFVMTGFGTVVTGTAVAGSVAVESEVELHPAGRILRVRGIQVHGSAANKAEAGQRTALNLTGIDVEELRRGMVLTTPRAFRPATSADCMVEILASAQKLKNGTPVHLHAGTAEAVATVRTLDGSRTLEPGTTVPVRLLLQEPLLLVPGDRFILRKFSPVVTIGGGEIVDAFPPAKIRRGARERCERLAGASLSERMAAMVAESPYGLSFTELAIRTGVPAAEIKANLPSGVLTAGEPASWALDKEWADRAADRWQKQLAEYHRVNPLVPGIRREELRSRELPQAPPFVFDFLLGRAKKVICSGEIVHLASHKLALKQDEEQALAKIETAFQSAGLAVPPVKDVLGASGIDAARARSLLQILFRQKRLVRVTEDLVFHPSALQELSDLLATRKGSRFSVPEFKDWTGISRKYAIPLLEHLDREHVTRREGDVRIVL
jgi:selenocysteine-specific elongation factor